MLAFLIGPLIDCDMWIPLQATVSCRLRVCFLIPLSRFCLFISVSIMGESFPSFQSSSVCSLLFDFVLSPLYLLPCLAAFPQTWHKQKKEGVIKSFQWAQDKKRSIDTFLTRSIWIDATRHCFKSVTVEVADLSAFGHNISSTHHIWTVHFSLKWQIIAKEILFLNTECSLSRFHTYTLMHRNCQLELCALMICRQKVKGHSWVGALTVSKTWTGVLLSLFMSAIIWPLGVTVSLLSPHLIGGLDVSLFL